MSQPDFRNALPLGLLLITVSLLTGCHRSFYRLQADEEALALIAEKTTDPRWSLPGYQFLPDQRSRMYSPFSQDHPPMPPDDPTSDQIMQVVDGKPGYPRWHANGDTPYVENPEWRLFLPLNEDDSVTLDMKDAFRLALLHNREYQFQNEQLYLAALEVSLQRFDFETQLFAGYQTFFSLDGWRRGASSLLDARTRNVAIQKAGITGSTLVVGFANAMLWQLSGPNTQSVNTLVDFSMIQPLLRGAGRDRILEPLTQTERSLLAVVRDLERFRRQFYLGITTGQTASGLGSSGYLDLLQTQQQIRIREANVATQRSVVAQFKALVEAGRIDNQQLQFTQSSLYSAQEQLLRQKNAYQFALDRFKIDVGLPPDLEVIIEDGMLDQFELVDAEMTDRQNRLTNLQETTGSSILFLLDLRRDRAEELGFPIGAVDFNASGFRVEVPPVASVDWTQDLVDGLQEILGHIEEAEGIHREILEISIPQAKADIELLENRIGDRLESLALLRDKLERISAGAGDYAIEPEVLSADQLEESPEELRNFVALVELRLQQFGDTLVRARNEVQFLIEQGDQLSPVARAAYLQGDVTSKVPTYLRELAGLYLELTLIQVEARTDSIVLNPVDVVAEQAFEVAKLYRRDWMNARADLVDAWRQIEFVADQLESEFDLVLEGDVSNVSKNPLDLQASTGRVRAGFEFDSPITRLAERNNYRAALIRYERARRAYYAFEDQINLELRQIIRTIEQIKYNFEISRRGVKLAVMRVDQTDSELSRPPSPNASSRSLGSTAARDLLNALDDLRDTQLNFLDQWVSYEILRRNLDLDMGTMRLDDEGMWIEPGEFTPERIQELIEEALSWPQPESAYGGLPPEFPLENRELLGEPLEGEILPPAEDLYDPEQDRMFDLKSIDPELDPSGALPLRQPANDDRSQPTIGQATDRSILQVSFDERDRQRASNPPPRELPWHGSQAPPRGRPQATNAKELMDRVAGERQASERQQSATQLPPDKRKYFEAPQVEGWQRLESKSRSEEQASSDLSSRRSRRK